MVSAVREPCYPLAQRGVDFMAAENSSGSGSSEKESGLLTSVAETIGSTLGTLVARAGAAQKSSSLLASETVATVRKATAKVSSTKKPRKRAAAKKISVKRAVKSAKKSKSKVSRKPKRAVSAKKRRQARR